MPLIVRPIAIATMLLFVSGASFAYDDSVIRQEGPVACSALCKSWMSLGSPEPEAKSDAQPVAEAPRSPAETGLSAAPPAKPPVPRLKSVDARAAKAVPVPPPKPASVMAPHVKESTRMAADPPPTVPPREAKQAIEPTPTPSSVRVFRLPAEVVHPVAHAITASAFAPVTTPDPPRPAAPAADLVAAPTAPIASVPVAEVRPLAPVATSPAPAVDPLLALKAAMLSAKLAAAMSNGATPPLSLPLSDRAEPQDGTALGIKLAFYVVLAGVLIVAGRNRPTYPDIRLSLPGTTRRPDMLRWFGRPYRAVNA